jgi:tubulin delta
MIKIKKKKETMFFLLFLFQMSCIILQLGQCGNQVGQRLFDTLIEDNLTNINQKLSSNNRLSINDYIRHSLDRFFIQYENKLTARALAIDTELKVIEQLMDEKSQTKRHWCYEKKCIIEGIYFEYIFKKFIIFKKKRSSRIG